MLLKESNNKFSGYVIKISYFEVSMNDIILMQIFDAIQSLAEKLEGLSLPENVFGILKIE